MRTICNALLLSVLFFAGSTSLLAQMTDGKPRFGLKLGVNGANLYDDANAKDKKSRIGITGGAFAQIPFAKGRMSVRPELLFATKGGTFDFNLFNPDIKLSYVELPISIEYRLLGFVNLHAGMHASLLATAEGKIEGLPISFDKDDFEKFDYGWHLGGGLDFGGLGLHLRVSRGLMEIAKESTLLDYVGELKNSAWAVTLSYGF